MLGIDLYRNRLYFLRKMMYKWCYVIIVYVSWNYNELHNEIPYIWSLHAWC